MENKPHSKQQPQMAGSAKKHSSAVGIIKKQLPSIPNRGTNTNKPQNKGNNRQSSQKSNSKLRVIPMGGLQEIGKNMTAFEFEDEIIVVDCGVAFPQDDMLGIDLVIPDFSYLEKNKEKFKAVFLTHGHEDHIGSLPYLLKQFNVPVYGTRLTLGLVENKLREHGLLGKVKMNNVYAGDRIKKGSFEVEFIHVTHSIADCCALAIRTPAGLVVHSGDFKIDYTPIDGDKMDLIRFAELGREGVDLFLCESTNVEQKGFTLSERAVGGIFEQIFDSGKDKRIVVATFSSNIHRIQQVLNCAANHNRKVAVMGRSMENAVRTARELGYLIMPENIIIEPNQIKNYSPHETVIMTTGSQGEPMAALSRMASSEHKMVEVGPGDKIIISSSPIPGNEKMVSKVINELMKKGADVIYEGLMDVHVSGHAKQEEIKLLHALVKPKYLMPVHGEYRHLKTHKDLAITLGMQKENIFLMSIGDVLEVSKASGAKLNGTVPVGQILVDGLGVGDVGNIVLRDRKHLSEDGLMIVVVALDRDSGHVVSGPEIISRGFVYVRESGDLMDEAVKLVRDELYDCERRRITDWTQIKNIVRDELKEFLWQKTKRSPMIMCIIMEV